METWTLPIKLFLIPGSLSFLILAATVSAFLLLLPGAASRRAGRRLLLAIVAVYWLLSIPAVASALENGYPVLTASDAERCIQGGGCTIVVLGSGIDTFESAGRIITRPGAQTALNALRGVELTERAGGQVIVSGGVVEAGTSTPEGEVLRSILEEHGIARARIVVEARSRTTHEQMLEVAALARERGYTRLVVVTSRAQLRRALGVLRAQGLVAAGYPAPFMSDRHEAPSRWMPSVGACLTSHDALYEYLAFTYYWARGWLA